MAFNYARLPNVVISSGTSTSTIAYPTDDAYGVSIVSPSTLTGTITVQVEHTDTGTNFVNLQSGGVDVTMVAAKALVITPCPFKQIQLISDSVEAAGRTFTMAKVIPV